MTNKFNESIYLDEIQAPKPQQPSTSSNHPIESLNSHCPQAPRHPFKPFHLNFTRKFAKSTTGKLSRTELEELLMVKITEAIVYREKNSKLRLIVERHEEMVKNLETRLLDCQKHIRDLEYINDNIMQRIEQMPSEPLQLVRIVRNIGVQIYEQDLMPGEIYTIDLSEESPKRNPFRRSPVRTPSPPPVKRNKRKREMKKGEESKSSKKKKTINLDSTLLPVEERVSRKRTLRSNQESTESSAIDLTALEPQFSSTLLPENETRKKTMQLDSTLIEEDEEPPSKSPRLEMTLEMPSIVVKSPKKLKNPLKNSQILKNFDAATQNYPKLPEKPSNIENLGDRKSVV